MNCERGEQALNSQKVTQVLVDIFRRCGPEILCKREKFGAHLKDLLNENDYFSERAVLRQALNTTVLLPLADQNYMADGLPGRIKEQLIKENRMEESDASFVVDCITAARSQAEGIFFVRTEDTQTPNITMSAQMELGPFTGGEEHWKTLEKHLLYLEEQLRHHKEKIILRLNVGAIALFLVFAAVFSSWRAEALRQEIGNSQSTNQDEAVCAGSGDDRWSASVSGPVPQQTQG